MKLLSNKTAQAVFGVSFAFALVIAAGLPLGASAAMLTRQLDLGVSGTDVSDLQTFLAADPSVYPEGLVTGYFGSLTQAAVIAFQVKNGLSAVGRVGPLTLSAINSQMNVGAVVGNDRTSPIIGAVSINLMPAATSTVNMVSTSTNGVATTTTTTVSSPSATLSWNTDKVTSGILYVSTTPIVFTEGAGNGGITVSGSSVIANVNLQTAHTVTLTGLQANTNYNYVVYAKDGSGNESITWPSAFRINQ